MGQLVVLPAPQSPPLPAFDVSPVLDGVTYTLRFQWMATDNGWRISVLDEPGQVVLMGQVRVVSDWPLYASRISQLRAPPGLLMVFDSSGKGEPPTLAGLGDRWQLLYYTAAEVAAVQAAG